jgi:putative membrane protein
MASDQQTSSQERPSPEGTMEEPAVQASPALPGLVVRGCVGGALMGLANLVPGVSGGTVLLATGIYPAFVNGIAEVSTLRFRLPSLVVLATVAASAILAIGLLAGLVRDWVVLYRWPAYSLFIGLTLGGLPVIWRMIGRPSRSAWIGAGAGLVAMSALALVQQAGKGVGAGAEHDLALLVLAGIGSASAMVLPGISGGYVLLVLGQYVPILSAVDAFGEALSAGDLAAAAAPALRVLLPAGLGMIAGIVIVSNLVKLLLQRFSRPTLGVLLGLLLGAVVGLWPFRAPVEPVPGELVAGQVMTEETIAELPIEKWPTQTFVPSPAQATASLLLVVLGFSMTTGVAWAGRALESRDRRPKSATAGRPT